MRIFKTSKQWRQTTVTLLVNLLSVHLGVIFCWSITNFHQPIIAGITGKLVRLRPLPLSETEPFGLKLLRRLAFLCILAVLPLAAFIAERFGRKKALALSAIPFALFSIMIAAVDDFYWITGAMTCGGVACALQFYLVPMYVSEISSDNRRGAHGIIQAFFIAIGVCLGYIVTIVWLERVNAILSLILPAVFLILLVILPESPVWLARKNSISEADRVLAWLGIDESSSVSKNVTLNEELENIESTNAEPIAFRKIFKLPEVRKGFVVSVGLLVGQAIIQINSLGAFFIATYGLVFRMFSIYHMEMVTWPLVINIAILIAVCIAASLLIDRIGRIPLLIVSCIGMIIAFIIMCTAVGVGSYIFNVVNITTAIIYIICYFVGLGSVPSVIAVEIIPNNVVSYVYAASMGIFWIVTWIVAEIFTPFWMHHVYFQKYFPYFCFGQAIICAFLLFFVIAFVPETNKRPILSPVSVLSQ